MEARAPQIVAELFKSAMVAGTTVMMSVVNWGEVYYTLVTRIGIAKAEDVIAETLRSAPIVLLSVTPDDAIRASRLKAQYNLPYADSFAAALAGNQNVLVTADVEHFERLPKLRLVKLPRAQRT
jgi:predicted nucleic acid-binding protein